MNRTCASAAPVLVLVVALTVLASTEAFSQTTSGTTAATTAAPTTNPQSGAQTTQPGTPGSQTGSAEPVPYAPDEFPLWARDLRRAEVITIGVLPFSLVYTNLMFDLGRYLVLLAGQNPSASLYRPWFFAPPDKPPLTANEKLGVVLGSIGVAVVVGLIDYAINSSQRRAAEERAAARAAAVRAIAGDGTRKESSQ